MSQGDQPKSKAWHRDRYQALEGTALQVVKVWLEGPRLGEGELGFWLHRLKDVLNTTGAASDQAPDGAATVSEDVPTVNQ